jgi:hypothetical protein
MIRIVERAQLVDVLSRRNVAQGVGRADKIAARGSRQPFDSLDEHVAKATFEQLRAECRGADPAKLRDGDVGDGFHVHAPVILRAPLIS